MKRNGLCQDTCLSFFFFFFLSGEQLLSAGMLFKFLFKTINLAFAFDKWEGKCQREKRMCTGGGKNPDV